MLQLNQVKRQIKIRYNFDFLYESISFSIHTSYSYKFQKTYLVGLAQSVLTIRTVDRRDTLAIIFFSFSLKTK